MENIKCLGHSFQWKKYHPTPQNHVKSILSIAIENKEDQEQPDFPKSFTKIEEGERHLDEAKPLEWIDAEIKTKEFDISNDDRPKMLRIGDYWSEKKTIDIFNLLK
jgi:hypothetical protein